MSGCSPHPQIANPCADDGVSVGQALGTRGDINFDENGTYNLSVGVTNIKVSFLYEKDSASYVFEYLYIRMPDGTTTPLDIRPVVKEQTRKDFTVELSGAPTIPGCVLYWHIIVPDPLHICQGLVAQPQYAQVRYSQQGVTLIPSGVEFVDVTFPLTMPDNDWVFEALTIEFNSSYPGGPPDPTDVQVTPFTVMLKTQLGFKLALAGTFAVNGYAVRWKVA